VNTRLTSRGSTASTGRRFADDSTSSRRPRLDRLPVQSRQWRPNGSRLAACVDKQPRRSESCSSERKRPAWSRRPTRQRHAGARHRDGSAASIPLPRVARPAEEYDLAGGSCSEWTDADPERRRHGAHVGGTRRRRGTSRRRLGPSRLSDMADHCSRRHHSRSRACGADHASAYSRASATASSSVSPTPARCSDSYAGPRRSRASDIKRS
jgi:hypothetical protein